jgi:hypothetical protein
VDGEGDAKWAQRFADALLVHFRTVAHAAVDAEEDQEELRRAETEATDYLRTVGADSKNTTWTTARLIDALQTRCKGHHQMVKALDLQIKELHSDLMVVAAENQIPLKNNGGKTPQEFRRDVISICRNLLQERIRLRDQQIAANIQATNNESADSEVQTLLRDYLNSLPTMGDKYAPDKPVIELARALINHATVLRGVLDHDRMLKEAATEALHRLREVVQVTPWNSKTEALGDYYRRIADQAVGSLKAGGMNSWLPFIDKYTHYVGRPSTLESLQVQLEAVFKKVEMLATRLEDSQQQTARVTDRLAKQSSWLPQLFQTHEAMLGQFNTAEEALHKLDKVLTLASKVAHTKMAATPPANPYQWTAEQRRAIIELAEQMQRGNFAVLPGKPGIQPDPNRKPDNDDPHFTYYSY